MAFALDSALEAGHTWSHGSAHPLVRRARGNLGAHVVVAVMIVSHQWLAPLSVGTAVFDVEIEPPRPTQPQRADTLPADTLAQVASPTPTRPTRTTSSTYRPPRLAEADPNVGGATSSRNEGAPLDDIEVADSRVDSNVSSGAVAVASAVTVHERVGGGSAPLADLSRPPISPPLDRVLARYYPRDAVRSSGLSTLRVEILPSGAVGQTSVVRESQPGYSRACDLTVRSAAGIPALDATGSAIVAEIAYTCRFIAALSWRAHGRAR